MTKSGNKDKKLRDIENALRSDGLLANIDNNFSKILEK